LAHEPVDDTIPGELTPFAALDEVLNDYAHVARDVLNDNFVGLYLLGSLAIGDFDLTSDVDFVIVTTNELDDDEVRRVQSRHAEVLSRSTRWVKHLEYCFFPVQQLYEESSSYVAHGQPTESAPRQLWYFGNGSSTIERSDHDNTLVTRWTLRNRSPAERNFSKTSHEDYLGGVWQ
jgi:predicted nucleotidyltransferase